MGSKKIPHILEVVDANNDQRQALQLAVRFNTFSRTFITQPGVPSDMYNAWKKAFEETTRDPGFLKAAKAAGFDVGLGTAEDFNQLVRSFERLSPAGVKLLKRLIGQ